MLPPSLTGIQILVSGLTTSIKMCEKLLSDRVQCVSEWLRLWQLPCQTLMPLRQSFVNLSNLMGIASEPQVVIASAGASPALVLHDVYHSDWVFTGLSYRFVCPCRTVSEAVGGINRRVNQGNHGQRHTRAAASTPLQASLPSPCQ
jgi:hypothetical protein